MAEKNLAEALSIQATADLLSVHHMTVRRWIAKGYIKAVRVGPWLIRIPRSEISRLRTLRVTASENGEAIRYPNV
jgi:excisionase family DNA binding protein